MSAAGWHPADDLLYPSSSSEGDDLSEYAADQVQGPAETPEADVCDSAHVGRPADFAALMAQLRRPFSPSNRAADSDRLRRAFAARGAVDGALPVAEVLRLLLPPTAPEADRRDLADFVEAAASLGGGRIDCSRLAERLLLAGEPLATTVER
eukprot:TRINITY_DN60638_c0_g1_i1.p2 TRINITY_DN60638_c0_g1~~TRINITY_DN60638_c0_g1_i1.p2  ORF type:complete len:175 (+),score=69.57 TRINITY_DN60638_c0_g1_i1:70-525(+)